MNRDWSRKRLMRCAGDDLKGTVGNSLQGRVRQLDRAIGVTHSRCCPIDHRKHLLCPPNLPSWVRRRSDRLPSIRQRLCSWKDSGQRWWCSAGRCLRARCDRGRSRWVVEGKRSKTSVNTGGSLLRWRCGTTDPMRLYSWRWTEDRRCRSRCSVRWRYPLRLGCSRRYEAR